MDLQADDILERYLWHGGLSYDGEGVTQLQHAWQCGRLAAQAGASPALQLAAWLHDLGHLLTGLSGTPTLRGVDDSHEQLAAQALRPLFGDAVAEPVALHVEAKRYLVGVNVSYGEQLSADSRRSLALQGGPMAPDEAHRFRARPWAEDALRLRAWDDAGKLPQLQPDNTEAVVDALAALMQQLRRGATL